VSHHTEQVATLVFVIIAAVFSLINLWMVIRRR
jgi:hypothetical protein